MRLAGAVAEREVAEQEARRPAACSTMSLAQPITTVGMPNASRWRATRLQVWWQTGQFGTRIAASAPSSWHAAQDFRCVGLHGDAVAAVGRRAMEPRRHGADAAGGHGAEQRGQREPGAAVGRGGVDAVVADVRDAQIVGLRGVTGVGLVELRATVIGGAGALVAFVGAVGRGGGDDGQACLAQRLARAG